MHTNEKPATEAKPSGYYCRPDETMRFAALLLIVVLALALASLVLSATNDAPTAHRAPIRSAVMTEPYPGEVAQR